MGGTVPNLCVVDGQVTRLVVRKRPSEKYIERFGRVAAEAIRHGARHYAVKQYGRWQIWSVSGPQPILVDLTEAAASMWLLHRRRT